MDCFVKWKIEKYALGKVDFTVLRNNLENAIDNRISSTGVDNLPVSQNEHSQNKSLRNEPTSHNAGDVAITSPFGTRSDPHGRDEKTHQHKGEDLAVAIGSKVFAIADGTIIHAGWQNSEIHSGAGSGGGMYVHINHNNVLHSLYMHMSKILVGNGDKVDKGQMIGLSGNTGDSTGAHLHLEVRVLDPITKTMRAVKPTQEQEETALGGRRVTQEASMNFPLTKRALNIQIQPYEALVDKALKEIEAKEPGYFASVKTIVIEPGGGNHFGKVESDKPDTIFISMDKIRAAMSGGKDEVQILATIREVLTHEMGHLKSKFQGGEAPAETESHRMEQKFSAQEEYVELICQTASEMSKAGFNKEAAILDSLINPNIKKQAYINPTSTPSEISQSLLRVIFHFVQKVKPENQGKYIDSVKRRIGGLETASFPQKRKNPGAGVGATVTVIKNMLSGLDAATVNTTVSLVFQGMEKMR